MPPERMDVDVATWAALWRSSTLAMQAHWPRRRNPRTAIEPNRDVPVPDIGHRRRVQGPGVDGDLNGAGFLAGGASDLRSVMNLFEVCSEASLTSRARILDWGVGCGRMIRHLPSYLRQNAAGIDVDPVNIEWCKANIPFGSYHCTGLFGPIPFPDKHFDLIYSHSVLTHLDEDNQFIWLKELARVARGPLVLSVHGMISAAKFSWSETPQILASWLSRGFLGTDRQNPDIADVTPQNYYTDVNHSAKYIYDRWSHLFDIKDIVIGGFGQFHDGVVCVPR
jgi:hypothetical protein